jgi:hypothetical protein
VKHIVQMLFLLSILSINSLLYAATMNILPDNLPPNLPQKIKGKYRLIEHNANSSQWVAYDFSRYSNTAEGIKMYPPVYTYDYLSGKKGWLKRVDNAPLENMYTTELVTLINAGAKLGNKPSDGKQISAQEAIAKVKQNIKHSSAWQLSSKPFKNSKGKSGYMICGKNSVNTVAQGVWWCTGSNIMSVNGIAKGNTPNFEMTYDVEVSEGLSACGF